MRTKPTIIGVLFLAMSQLASGQAPSRITYQGELQDNGCLAEGTYAMEFSIWSSLTGGTQYDQISMPEVAVSEGRFTVDLVVDDDTFVSTVRYLEVTVEGVTLSPRERITSVPYSLRTRGIFVDENNNVGIGTSIPDKKLEVVGDVEMRGDVNVTKRMAVGGDPDSLFGQLNILDSGDGAPFGINANWDSDTFATIFASNAGSGGVLYAQGSSDASPAGGGIIVAGDEAGSNVAIDANEIMARDGGNTAPLYLNNEGGDVIVGGTLDIGWVYMSEDFEGGLGCCGQLFCPEGMRPIGGGCNALVGLHDIYSNHPVCGEDGCGWSCHLDTSDGVRVHVLCANVK